MSAYIQAIGTAVPQYCYNQNQIAGFMADALQLDEQERRKLIALYRSTRIAQRHSMLADYGVSIAERHFYPKTLDLEPFPTISQRMALYRKHALPLALAAVNNCFSKVNQLDCKQITHLITVSCTGLYAPGLDIELVENLGLQTSIERTAINFMGCYGAFNGLKVAETICRANPAAKVLVVCVELCSIHFQKKHEDDHLLANSLFADGAAAVLVSAEEKKGISLRIKSFYCDLVSEGRNDMAWQVADFGFEMVLSSYIPKLVKSGIGVLVERLLQKAEMNRNDISLYAMHPGGRAILEAIEQALGLKPTDNYHAYEVLKMYGNMSSATVLFVLESLCSSLQESDNQRTILSCAFGPGLTLESMLTEVVCR